MEISRLENQDRVYLYPYELETIVENAENMMAKLTILLGGKVGLRVAEIQWVKVKHIDYLSRDEGDQPFLYVPKFDSDPQVNEQGRPRSVFLPQSVERQIVEYADSNGYGPDDELFPRSKRSLQKYVKDSAKNAAEATGNEDFTKVSASDFRAYFARNMVENHHIHPEVVRKMGGWNIYGAIQKHLHSADEDLVVKEYRRAGIE